MSKSPKICSLSGSRFRGHARCDEPAEYRVRVILNTRRDFLLYLCHSHMPRSSELAQILLDRHIKSGEEIRIECISLHTIKRLPKLLENKQAGAAAA